MTLVGADFSVTDYTLTVSMSGTVDEATRWVSDSTVISKSASGIQSTRTLAVSTGLKVSTTSQAVSSDIYGLSLILPANHPATGSASITIYGRVLALRSMTPKSSSGPTALSATSWISETSIVGKTVRSRLASRHAFLTIGREVGTSSFLISIDLPSVSTLNPRNRATTGSLSLSMGGSAFGLMRVCGRIQTGSTSSETTFWKSDSSLLCRISRLLKNSLRVAVTLGRYVQSATFAMSSGIAKVSSYRKNNLATTGSVYFTIFGVNIGRFQSVFHQAKLRIGFLNQDSDVKRE